MDDKQLDKEIKDWVNLYGPKRKLPPYLRMEIEKRLNRKTKKGRDN